MRLRTYESFWLLKNGLMYSYPMLKKNLRSEIVVLGGGITGALISDALLDAGYQVTLIDKRDIGQGSTSATTSLLQYEIDEQLQDLTKKIGAEGAVLTYKAGISAVRSLGRLVSEREIDCGFKRKQSLYIAHNAQAEKKLYKEFTARKKAGIDVDWLTAAQLKKTYGLVCFGGIKSHTAASIDAFKFAHELIQKNVQRGLHVYDQTCIKKFVHRPRSVEIHTESGPVITCKKVVFCTGYESTELLKEKIADLFYTYAVVSEQNPDILKTLDDVLIWNTEDPYLYCRTTDDGRLLAGGLDDEGLNSKPKQERKVQKARDLCRKVSKLLPQTEFVEDFSWGGMFGSTKDGLPYIGVSPEFKNGIFVLGFGGNGITFSVQGRDIVTDLLAGRENELGYYYRFGR